MALQNRRYKAKNMNRSEYTHLNNVHITENATVGRMFVAGDLTVDGDLRVDHIFCLGKLKVGGQFVARDATLGTCMAVAGAVEVDYLAIGLSDDTIARGFLRIQNAADAARTMWKGVHPTVIENYRRLVKTYRPGVAPALIAPSLVCRQVYVNGSAWVVGPITTNYIEVSVNLQAAQIDSKTCVHSSGILACTGDITAGEQCTSEKLVCGGNIRAHELFYGTSEVSGSVKAQSISPGSGGLLRTGPDSFGYSGRA